MTGTSPERQPRWKRYAVGGALLTLGIGAGGALGNTMVAGAATPSPVASATSTAAAADPTAGGAGTSTADTETNDGTETGTETGTDTEVADGTEAQDGADTGAADTETNDGADPAGADETAVTGTDADKVTAAVLAQYPGGTVDRVEGGSAGAFEAHLTTADGQDLSVQVGADFTVTGLDTGAQN